MDRDKKDRVQGKDREQTEGQVQKKDRVQIMTYIGRCF